MTSNPDAIYQLKEVQIQTILQEIADFGDFKSQFKNLAPFRELLRGFYQWKFLDQIVSYKVTKIKEGDVLDHHIAAYFSPFSFRRKSWGGGQK